MPNMRAFLAFLPLLALGPSVALGEEAAEAPDAPETAAPAEGPAAGDRDEPESSERRLRVVVLEVTFSGTVAEPLRERLTSGLAEALRRQGLDVVEPPAVAAALSPLGSQSCRAGRCVGWILEALDGDAGLVAYIDVVESSYAVRLTLLGTFGDEIGRAERRCDICTFDEVADSVAIAGSHLVSQIPRRVFVGRLGVFPTPIAASISVDGVAVGHGSLSITLPIGLHTVEARAPGYRVGRREVLLRTEDSTRVEIDLVRGQMVRVDEGSRLDPFRAALWSTITAGAVIALTGTILMGINGSCWESGGSESCNDAFAAGTGLLSFGLGLGGAGGLGLGAYQRSQER
jgi:hypothetical protein